MRTLFQRVASDRFTAELHRSTFDLLTRRSW